MIIILYLPVLFKLEKKLERLHDEVCNGRREQDEELTSVKMDLIAYYTFYVMVLGLEQG